MLSKNININVNNLFVFQSIAASDLQQFTFHRNTLNFF